MAGTGKTLMAALTACIVLLAGFAAYAENDPETAIRAALEQWRQDFNARRSEHICDLFAPELLYDFQGLPEQNYERLCARLHAALSDPLRRFSNELRIKEILVSGSLAVVRLTWVSTLTDAGGISHTDDEQGLDVFGLQPDGSWKIIRYIAYPAHPE